jgi:hypothetical protein
MQSIILFELHLAEEENRQHFWLFSVHTTLIMKDISTTLQAVTVFVTFSGVMCKTVIG